MNGLQQCVCPDCGHVGADSDNVVRSPLCHICDYKVRMRKSHNSKMLPSEFRVRDLVRYSEDGKWKLSGIITELIGDDAIVDTLIGPAYMIPLKDLEIMLKPKGVFTIESPISKESVKRIRELFYQSISETDLKFKTPIIKKD